MPLLFPTTHFIGRKRPKIVGTPTKLISSDASDYSTKNFTDHTSATGNIVFIGGARSNAGATPLFQNWTWGGGVITGINADGLNGVGRGMVYAGYIRKGLTGNQTLAVNASAGGIRDFIGWAIDIDAMAQSPIGGQNADVVQTVQASYGLAITVQNQFSLVLGMTLALDEDADTITVNSPWSSIDHGKTGTGTTSDLAATIAQRIDSLGSVTLTGTATGAVTTDDWGCSLLELLPY